jgi:DNA invertase Pin-like site-specific DNA recombinase
MKVALYLRVSTLEQNPDAQRRELQVYAARHDWDIVDQYEDRASGAPSTRPGANGGTNRPELARLLADARAGKFDTVLVWKLDRFGRSLLDCLANLETLDTEAVRFIAVSQGLDTDRKNPASRLLLHVLAAAAEFERELIRERSTSGMRRYQADLAAGKVGESVHSKSGKDLPPHRPRKVLDGDRILFLRDQGHSWHRIGKMVGATASTLVRRFGERALQKVG